MCLLSYDDIRNGRFRLGYLLYFDVLAVDPYFTEWMKDLGNGPYPALNEMWEKVYNQGFAPLIKEDLFLLTDIAKADLEFPQSFIESPPPKDGDNVALKNFQEQLIRSTAIKYSSKYDVSIPGMYLESGSNELSSKQDVNRLVFHKIPRLFENVKIDNLREHTAKMMDFKKDPDTKLKLAALRDWMTEISKKDYTKNEIEDKMEYLLMQYQDHMDRAKLKYTLGSAEFWITAVPDIVNDLANLKLGSAAKALFGFGKKELMLMEEERKAPGRELAFVYKARQEFG